MKQVLNIFLKDVRHSWGESAASIALVVAFGWNEVRGWAHEGAFAVGIGGLFDYRFLSGLVVVLVPIAWSFLAVRVIQSESLVGDRQFWVTRPYEWKKLMSAKVLFVLTFVNLPLLVLDLFLLKKAGFTPTNYKIGLAWMQLMMLFFMLPITALATVTASVGQTLLALLVIVLYMMGMGILSEYIPSSSFSGPVDSVTGVPFVCVCLAVILLQYARRKTAQSRLLIAGLAGVFLLILVATPYRTIVDREFPHLEAGQQSPFQLSLLPAETSAAEAAPDEGKEVQIQMPLSVSGIAPESVVVVDGVFIAIEVPNGPGWDSGWKPPRIFLFSGQKRTQVAFTLKRNLFERMKSYPVRFRMSLAFTLFHDKNRRQFVTPHGKFAMAGVGLCSAEPGYFRRIHCLAPLRRPSFLLMTADASASTCPVLEGESPPEPGEIARGWTQNGDGPAEFGISPVKVVDLYLSDWTYSAKHRSVGICPGTPLVLSDPEPVRRNQLQVLFDGVRLVDYEQKPIRFAMGNPPITPRMYSEHLSGSDPALLKGLRSTN